MISCRNSQRCYDRSGRVESDKGNFVLQELSRKESIYVLSEGVSGNRISGRDLDETTAKRNNLVVGVYVASVDEYSAAEKAGIKAGDVIVKADGQEIKTMTELNNIKNTHNIGDTMTVTVNRNGQEKEITLTLQEQ